MVIELESGRYLHTAYAISDVAEELLPDEWSTTERADGMDYVGTYTDDSPTDSTDATDYEWEEIYDLDVDDTDEDDEMPVAEEQSQIASVEERLNILEQDSENMNEAIDNLNTNVEGASTISSDAMDIAQATGQHFWTDTDGVHISNEEGVAEGERNTLWNSLGMLFRRGANNIIAILTGGASGTGHKGLAIYDGEGNADENIIAKFTDAEISLNPQGVNEFNVQKEDNTITLTLTEKEDIQIPSGTTFSYSLEGDVESGSTISVYLYYATGESGAWGRNFTEGVARADTINYGYFKGTISYDGNVGITIVNNETSPDQTIHRIEYVSTITTASFTFGKRRTDVASLGRGIFSLTGGVGLYAPYDNEVVFGSYNSGGYSEVIGEPLFVIGNGTEEESSDALVVGRQGNVSISGDYKVDGEPIFKFATASGTMNLTTGHVVHTTTYTLPSNYNHILGVRAIDSNHQSVLQMTAFNVNGDGSFGARCSLVVHYFNRSSSNVGSTTVTWELLIGRY